MPTLEETMKKINKSWGEDVLTLGKQQPLCKRIPFSSPRANYMTYGGIPMGRLVEFSGEEGSGKTTTALDVVGNAQHVFQQEFDVEIDELTKIAKPSKTQQNRLSQLQKIGPRKVLYVDAENTLDVDWAELLGVDVNSMIIYQPQGQAAEEIFEDTLNLIESDEVGLVVLDSLGCLVSAQAYDKTMEEKTMGGIAMALTLFAKKTAPLCMKRNCTLIGINQVRDDMNSRFNAVTTPGGKGWKHMCSVRMMFRKGSFVDEWGDEIKRSSESPYGNQVQIDIAKTKVFKPDRRIGFYTLNYYNGVDVIQDTIELALKYDIIIKGGSWFTFRDIETGELINDKDGEMLKLQGRASVVKEFQNNDELFDTIAKSLNKIISE